MKSTYSGFLNHFLEAQNQGKDVIPNPANAFTASRLAAKDFISNFASEHGEDEADVALQIVEDNRGKLEKYVMSKGEMPLSNSAELAVQVFLNHEADIKKIQDITGLSREDAEVALEAQQAYLYNQNHPEADSFLGAVLAAVGSVASNAIHKAAEKRAAKGKKAGFWGGLDKAVNGIDYETTKQAVNSDPQAQEEALQSNSLGTGVAITAKEILEEVKREEKRKEIKKMLPWIIGGVIVLIIVVMLVARASKK